MYLLNEQTYFILWVAILRRDATFLVIYYLKLLAVVYFIRKKGLFYKTCYISHIIKFSFKKYYRKFRY